MGSHIKTIRLVVLSVVATMVVMRLMSMIPGFFIPARYYLVGLLCSGGISTPVLAILVRQRDENRRLRMELEDRLNALRRATEVDALTGLLARQTFLERAEALGRTTRQAWVMIVDVDHFKCFNDSHGHQTGDAVLRAIGSAMCETTRADDLCGRLGGEEFAVCLGTTDPSEARRIADHMASAIRALRIRDPSGRISRATASIGLARFDPDQPIAASLHQADLAMYAAKHGGRDQVRVAA
jgi:diguanylate cyclase (GGDEF)-like protein